jgi:galactokinase
MGARMVGGGFGGSAIALIKASDVQKTRDAVSVAFETRGFKKPRFFTSLPSAGASANLLN